MKATALLCTAAILVTMTSCDSGAKLISELQGEWTGNPERILDSGAASASMVRVLEFTRGAADTEGTVTMTALITVENTMEFNDSIVTPLQISATGTATITGTFQAKDRDELLVSLDATSLNVEVDPQAVQLNYNIISESSAPIIEKLKPGAAILATQQINHAAQSAFTNITEIDDIEIKNNIMTCEISNKDLAFTRAIPTK